jgi:NAD(P)H-hydrate epimerase
VTLAGDASTLKEAPRRQWRILDRMGLTAAGVQPEASDLCIDALLGYGIRGDPRPAVGDWIERLNAAAAPILALDVPSGLDATTGQAGNPCIRAAATLTLALPKTGLLLPAARQHVGSLLVADIGVPPELYARPELGLEVQAIFGEGAIVRLF